MNDDELALPYDEEEIKFDSLKRAVNEWLKNHPQATIKETIAFEDGYHKGADDWY